MSFPNSPGVYDRIVDKSFIVSSSGLVSGGIVITSDKGPTDLNTITSAKDFIDTYGLPDTDNPSKWAALRFLARGSVLSVVRAINDAVSASGTLLKAANPHLDVEAENEGVWGNLITVTFADLSATEGAGVFNLFVNYDGEVVETFKASRDVNAKDGYGANIFVENVVNGRSKYITVADYPTETGDYDYSATVTLAGGLDDTVAVTSGQINTAWDLFQNGDDVPATLLINAGFASVEVQNKMLSVAAIRKNSVAILDVPQLDNADVAAMILYRDTTLNANSFYGGIYGGWITIYDQFNDREVDIPPSGDVAGIFAYTVEVGERWDAPAGIQRGIIPNALGVTKVFNEAERDLLYLNGINPVTSIGGANAVIWGQKTLQRQASALDRFNVINFILWANQRMREALQPFVFQPNTKFTRDSIKFLLDSFLEGVKQRGGVYDYYVDTSEEINTPTVIDENQLLVDVFIKPTRTAEFIRQSVIVTPTGVSFG